MTLVAAHRGLSAEHPENTVRAFQAAVQAGFPCIELDIRQTHDGEVMVLHDATVDRTTNGHGRINDLDYDEVRGLDTGVGPVPRLEDALHALRGWRGLWDIEVKEWRATEHALDILHHHGVLARSQISSMDPRALEKAGSHMPGALRGLITLGPPDVDDLEAAAEMGCSWIHVDHDFLKGDVLQHLRSTGLKVSAWTVNDLDRARGLADLGVDMVITDSRDVLEAVPATERGF